MSNSENEYIKKKMLLDDEYKEIEVQNTTDDINDNDIDKTDDYDIKTLEILYNMMEQEVNYSMKPIGEYITINKIQNCILSLIKNT